MLPAGVGFTIVEAKIEFVRSITVKTGHVRPDVRLVRVCKKIGQSDGVIHDDSGQVLAKGSATCLVFRCVFSRSVRLLKRVHSTT
jgi:acyl-coenzyme A thioesterase PaaI-like protein